MPVCQVLMMVGANKQTLVQKHGRLKY